MTTERRERVLDLVGLLARLVLGGVLIVAGALKVGNPLGSARACLLYTSPSPRD